MSSDTGCPCCGALACNGLDEIARLMVERDQLAGLLINLDAAAFQFDAVAADMDRHLCDRRQDACEWCDARDRLDVALEAVKRSGVATLAALEGGKQ